MVGLYKFKLGQIIAPGIEMITTSDLLVLMIRCLFSVHSLNRFSVHCKSLAQLLSKVRSSAKSR